MSLAESLCGGDGRQPESGFPATGPPAENELPIPRLAPFPPAEINQRLAVRRIQLRAIEEFESQSGFPEGSGVGPRRGTIATSATHKRDSREEGSSSFLSSLVVAG
ncbi:hypothetical protein HPB47_002239, partial [Ixodes persulcatus]